MARRLAIIQVSFSILEAFLKGQLNEDTTVEGLPKEFKVIRVNDYAHQGINFDVTIESDELPEVLTGHKIPLITPIYHRKVKTE